MSRASCLEQVCPLQHGRGCGTEPDPAASNLAWTTKSAKRSEPKGSTPTTLPSSQLWISCAGNWSFLVVVHGQLHNRSMAWEWIGTTVLGLAGIFGTWFTGKQSRDQALVALQEQFDHDRLQAREAREQQRLENAYTELLRVTAQAGYWAQAIEPMVQIGPPLEIPMPSIEVQVKSAALMTAFATDSVRYLAETWEALLQQMIRYAELVHWEDQHPPQPGDARATRRFDESPRGALLRLRPQEKRAREELGAQVRAELRFLYRSSAKPTGVIRSYTYENGTLIERLENAALEGDLRPHGVQPPAPTPATAEQSAPPESQ